jgi:hypothetical protein
MPQDTEKTMKELAARLWLFPLEDYLSSENFLLFCRHYDLEDRWKEYLELSRDIPELYGSVVIKNAFVRFLHHIFSSRPKEFLSLFALLMRDFSGGISCTLPVDKLKSCLRRLGYPDHEIAMHYPG